MFNSIIKDNKGGILVITIVSMMILTIIGYVTLQMFSKQNVIDSYDQAKIRTDYCAEGIVEKARGYIDYVVAKNFVTKDNAIYDGLNFYGNNNIFGDIAKDAFGHTGYYDIAGYIHAAVSQSTDQRWRLFNDPDYDHYDHDYGYVNEKLVFDNSMHPKVYASVYCEFADDYEDYYVNGISTHAFSPYDPKQTYKIVGIASTTLNVAGGTLIVSTVTYYFETENRGDLVSLASGGAASGYAARNVRNSDLYLPSLMASEASGSASGSAVCVTNKRYLIGWRKQS